MRKRAPSASSTQEQAMLGRIFRLEQHGTTVGREILGGVVTFVAMSYIIFVQPASSQAE